MQNTSRTYRIPYWDPRNNNWSIENRFPSLAENPISKIRSARRYKQEWWGHHNNGSMSTAYALLHYMSMDSPGRFGPEKSVTELHGKIVRTDKADNRVYPDGSTLLAACKVAREEEWLPDGNFYWATTGLGALNYLHTIGPLLVSSKWYKSLYDRDDHRRCSIHPQTEEVGGLVYCVSGIFPKSGLVRIAQTWGDGYYFMSFRDFDRLVSEDGEVALLRGLPTI